MAARLFPHGKLTETPVRTPLAGEISRNGSMSSKCRRLRNTPDTLSPPVADKVPIKLSRSNSGLKIRKVAYMRFFRSLAVDFNRLPSQTPSGAIL